MHAIRGVPFIDTNVDLKKLVAAAASVRRNADGAAGVSLGDYVDPAKAESVFRKTARSDMEEIPWTEPTSEHLRAVARASDKIVRTVPEWAPLFALPIRNRRMDRGGISCTSILIPQTIYLGDEAFAAKIPLEETLVHEHAHVWLALITEAFDLENNSGEPEFTLPSGTAGKSARGVIFAAHFAAAAVMYYRRLVDGEAQSSARAEYLLEYLKECLVMTRDHSSLSLAGRAVHARLQSAYGMLEGGL